MEAADLAAKTEVERAKLLCFYHFKEDGETTFIMSNISAWMEECSFSKPNTSRLKTNLTKGKGRAFLGSKANKNAIEFVPTVLQTLERDYGALWTDTVTIESHDELIEEAMLQLLPLLRMLLHPLVCSGGSFRVHRVYPAPICLKFFIRLGILEGHELTALSAFTKSLQLQTFRFCKFSLSNNRRTILPG